MVTFFISIFVELICTSTASTKDKSVSQYLHHDKGLRKRIIENLESKPCISDLQINKIRIAMELPEFKEHYNQLLFHQINMFWLVAVANSHRNESNASNSSKEKDLLSKIYCLEKDTKKGMECLDIIKDIIQNALNTKVPSENEAISSVFDAEKSTFEELRRALDINRYTTDGEMKSYDDSYISISDEYEYFYEYDDTFYDGEIEFLRAKIRDFRFSPKML